MDTTAWWRRSAASRPRIAATSAPTVSATVTIAIGPQGDNPERVSLGSGVASRSSIETPRCYLTQRVIDK